MRFSNLFFKTFKEAPADADVPSHKLLERAGLIRRLSRGHFSYTPLMWKIMNKLKAIITEEMEKEGSQEVFLPQLHPKEVWDATGRWDAYKAEKLTFLVKDRDEHDYCLAPTHEEVMTHLVKNWITSYKQLPQNLFQIANKFRDEIRPRFGLMRCKEFIMKDGYSFCANTEQMADQYLKMRRAYQKILDRLELDYVIVQADSGKIGSSNSQSEEFQVVADIGEDSILICEDFAFNSEKAPCVLPPYPYSSHLLNLEEIKTPNTETIEDLQKFTGIPVEQLLKVVVYKVIYKDCEEFIAVGIRGDREINPVKLSNHLQALEIGLASDEELKNQGLKKGYMGPVNCSIQFIADLSSQPMTNFVCGANKAPYHLKNVNWKRDCDLPIFADFSQAKEGDLCPLVPGATYKEKRGIEVGHIFSFGDKYSKALEAFFQDEAGNSKPLLMGSYGIGVGRLAQAAVEQNYDENGIIWPKELVPFDLLLTAVNAKEEEQREACERFYIQLKKMGVDIALDDRNERLGFKLKDSDLVGIPYKMILGKNYFAEGNLEVEPRVGEKFFVHESKLNDWVSKTFAL